MESDGSTQDWSRRVLLNEWDVLGLGDRDATEVTGLSGDDGSLSHGGHVRKKPQVFSGPGCPSKDQ